MLISQLIGKALVKDGHHVTIGETYGASQRGGAVMSHIRISRQEQYGPLIPEGQADVILGSEPVETMRVLAQYGHPEAIVIANSRPVYTMALGPTGYFQVKTVQAMGSGVGLACGFGNLARTGFEQPVVSVCGDSTFFHAAIPALLNGIYNNSNFTLLVLDNRATAMTGFQPHPGIGETATGEKTPVVDIEAVCRAMGVRVEVTDPFDLNGTTKKLLDLMRDDGGVRVLISKRTCGLLRAR